MRKSNDAKMTTGGTLARALPGEMPSNVHSHHFPHNHL